MTMSSGVSNLTSDAITVRRAALPAFCLLFGLHGLAVMLVAATEVSLLGMVVFVLAWIVLNCLWFALLRRPTVAALLSLETLALLTLLSRFKYDKLWMTIDFVDVVRTQLCDCVPNAQSMACARYTNILQQLIVNLSEQINVDVVGLEGVGILAKAVRLQPFPDLAHALSCSSSALASVRSSVSKPSVNQP